MGPSPRTSRVHAFKNCLAVVAAVNRLLESEVGETARQRLARSQEAVQRMLALVQEELTTESEQEAGKPRFVAAEDIVRAAIARVEDQADAAQVELLVQAGCGGVVGLGAELVEALVNIVLNAIEATPAGGTVLVATRACPDGMQVWRVSDTGMGIPRQVQEQLGATFVTGRKGGSGVGFVMARRTFEQHGAQLQVRSSRGVGTTISIDIPGVLHIDAEDVRAFDEELPSVRRTGPTRVTPP
jgi:two-component system, NtrC family, sensor histidine kinase HydH